ncbi:ATP-binding protein [Sporomusa malonica]|uniref:Histidine kinase-, DNA gyrase B-, and HSP90-like ATPase n=1 Tax=Sporomusa malonica TaxID=112901 RepID=A0A1W1ZWD9_9FIRM|nr:ATP-binding protein [Sporomusa malonica]SMC52552.1 Histidine kinase-, DNA gyrase B-, and HSP90-like ATPase [Sporomusa malonica]
MIDKTINIRKFTVAPDIIYSLIKAQAGTLAKSVGECIMNSVDAGATAINIVATQEKLIISDNGRGFRTREEIEQCFEVFGFDHQGVDRTFGQFGIGRAQLWNFCSTVWTTNSFRMDVDIKNKGLDYELIDGLPQQVGLVIEGRFYEPLSANDLFTFERECKELVKYVPIPVMLNGKRISKDSAKEKWTHDTPDAWIKIRETGDLFVYNLGFFVRRFPAYQIGCGGIVVTKPGVRLSLNMARNDILISECEVWKQIKPFLQHEAAGKSQRERMTTAKRNNMIHLFLAGELDTHTVKNAKLIQDVLGKYHVLSDIAPALLWGHKPISVAEPGNTLAEYIHRSKRGFIVTPSVLERFGAESVREFAEQIKRGMSGIYPWYKEAIPATFESFKDICTELSELRMPVPPDEWTKEEQATIATLNHVSRNILSVIDSDSNSGGLLTPRRIDLGVSDTAKAWTDGKNYITFDRKTISLAQKGIGGWQIILNVLIQEYLHANSQDGKSSQDDTFYQRYHGATVHGLENHIELLENAFIVYVNICRKKGVTINRRTIAGFDLLDGVLVDSVG